MSSHTDASLRGWMVSSACRGAEPRLFYPEPDERGFDRGGLTARAKAICARCPVVSECLAYALATRQNHGVWGGATERERRMMMARRAYDDAGRDR